MTSSEMWTCVRDRAMGGRSPHQHALIFIIKTTINLCIKKYKKSCHFIYICGGGVPNRVWTWKLLISTIGSSWNEEWGFGMKNSLMISSQLVFRNPIFSLYARVLLFHTTANILIRSRYFKQPQWKILIEKCESWFGLATIYGPFCISCIFLGNYYSVLANNGNTIMLYSRQWPNIRETIYTVITLSLLKSWLI